MRVSCSVGMQEHQRRRLPLVLLVIAVAGVVAAAAEQEAIARCARSEVVDGQVASRCIDPLPEGVAFNSWSNLNVFHYFDFDLLDGCADVEIFTTPTISDPSIHLSPPGVPMNLDAVSRRVRTPGSLVEDRLTLRHTDPEFRKGRWNLGVFADGSVNTEAARYTVQWNSIADYNDTVGETLVLSDGEIALRDMCPGSSCGTLMFDVEVLSGDVPEFTWSHRPITGADGEFAFRHDLESSGSTAWAVDVHTELFDEYQGNRIWLAVRCRAERGCTNTQVAVSVDFDPIFCPDISTPEYDAASTSSVNAPGLAMTVLTSLAMMPW